MTTIAIVDYGMGNLNSVQQALLHVCDKDTKLTIATTDHEIACADKVVFPGQGAAETCMQKIKQHGLSQALLDCAREKPFLGICMGLQILMNHSEENNGTECLNIFQGDVKHFKSEVDGNFYKIPHMGWNQVKQTQSHPLWHGIKNDTFFYFVHSYYTDPLNSADTYGTCDYGSEFSCTLAHDSIFAVQFHPEKSSTAGLSLLRNFVVWNGTI